MLHIFSQETDLFIKVIMKRVNIKLWDILGCFHYILNVPRIDTDMETYWRCGDRNCKGPVTFLCARLHTKYMRQVPMRLKLRNQ